MKTEAKTIEVKIPAGVQDGTRVRVAGKGQPGMNGGKRGDLYLHVVIPPDPIFRRQGSDVHVALPVYPWEAALGAEIMAPTLTEPVKVSASRQQVGEQAAVEGQGASIGRRWPRRSLSHPADRHADLGHGRRAVPL